MKFYLAVFFVFFFLSVVKVFSLPRPVLRLIIALQSFFGNLIDSLLQIYISCKINTLLVPQRLSHLINLLQCKCEYLKKYILNE